MLAVIGVMMSRSWTIASLQAFLPTWYKSLGYGATFYGLSFLNSRSSGTNRYNIKTEGSEAGMIPRVT